MGALRPPGKRMNASSLAWSAGGSGRAASATGRRNIAPQARAMRLPVRVHQTAKTEPGAARSPTAGARLSCCADACSEAVLMAHGFTVEQMAETRCVTRLGGRSYVSRTQLHVTQVLAVASVSWAGLKHATCQTIADSALPAIMLSISIRSASKLARKCARPCRTVALVNATAMMHRPAEAKIHQ
jgi:hypothetical protein